MSPPIIQPTFIIPPEIRAGIANGDLIRYGGVVRNQLGHIVKHLKEVQLNPANESASRKAASLARSPRVLASVAVVTAAALGASALTAVRKRNQRAIPDCVKQYNASLARYLEALQAGQLNESIIDVLLVDLEAVLTFCADSGNSFSMDFTSDQAVTLVGIVVDSTRQLARHNNLDIAAEESDRDSEGGNVVDLRHYLEVQRNIFKNAG